MGVRIQSVFPRGDQVQERLRPTHTRGEGPAVGQRGPSASPVPRTPANNGVATTSMPAYTNAAAMRCLRFFNGSAVSAPVVVRGLRQWGLVDHHQSHLCLAVDVANGVDGLGLGHPGRDPSLSVCGETPDRSGLA